MKKKVVATLTDVDGFEPETLENGLIVILVSKEDVVYCKTGSVVERLLRMSDSREAVERCANKVTLVFEGWDHDKRELVEIPEVTKYFDALTMQWPYWAHYVEKELHTCTMVTMLLCGAYRSNEGGKSVLRARMDNFEPTLLRLLNGMGALHDGFEIDESWGEQIASKFIAKLDSEMG